MTRKTARDPDSRASLAPLDAEAALRALLAVDPDAVKPKADDADADDAENGTAQS